MAGRTHDSKQYLRKTPRFSPHQRWQQGCPQVARGARGYVLFDETGLDKRDSRRVEPVRRRHGGNAPMAANRRGQQVERMQGLISAERRSI